MPAMTGSSACSFRAEHACRTATSIYDPIWQAASENGLPVAVHTHFDGVGISPPLTSAGHPDTYAEYHVLCGSGMYGHFVSIALPRCVRALPWCPDGDVEGGLVPFVGYLWRLDADWRACRSEVPHCRQLPSEYVWEPCASPRSRSRRPPTATRSWPADPAPATRDGR